MAKQLITEGISGEAAANIINENNTELYTGAETVAAAAKATPVNADVIPVQDSEASNVKKKVTWANIKATLKTYFDTLYGTVTNITDLEAEQVTQDEAIAVNTAKVGGVNATTVLRGGMAWVSGLTYQSLGLEYEINGTTFIIADGTEITYDVADGTNPRLDLIFGDDTGALGKSTGIPGATPSANTLESNQLQLTISLIEALATEPTGQSIITVFTEGVGQPTEYDATENTSGVRIDVANAVAPISGSLDIKTIANLNSGDAITLIHNDAVLINDFQYLKLSILSLRDWKSDFISVSLYNGTDIVGVTIVNKNIFDVADLVTVQEVTLFKSVFDIAGVQFDRIFLVNFSKDKILYQLDDIYIGLDTLGGGTTPTGVAASDVSTDTSNFDNNLSSADDNVQKALDTLNDLAAGGGGEFQLYKMLFTVDVSIVSQWSMVACTANTYNNEFNAFTGKADTGTLITLLPIDMQKKLPLGYAIGNQTVESFTMSGSGLFLEEVKKITIIKVKFSSLTVTQAYDYITELYRGDVVFDNANQKITIPASSFVETSISDGDIIFMGISAGTGDNIVPSGLELKCSID